MKLELPNNKDFWAGVTLIGIGAAAMFIARDYRFGNALRMRPGFIPALMALIFVSAASGREFKVVEVLLLVVVLTVTSTALFIWGLGLPYPLLKGL